METFLAFLTKVLKGIVHAISAYIFDRTFLRNKKTTPRRRKQKGGSQKQ